MLATLGSLATLGRWLGPWADDGKVPASVSVEAIAIPASAPGDRDFEAWLYTPRKRALRGAYLLAPGLHYAGPADPRMNRFCSVLAASGFAVMAPFLPDFAKLKVAQTLTRDLERTLQALLQRENVLAGRAPNVFSISFGSLPALRLAASDVGSETIGKLVIFGGYADWTETIHFCLTGEVDGRRHGNRDPLNQPVVFMNLIDSMPQVSSHRDTLMAAWRRYVTSTWGRPEMKAEARFHRVANDIAQELSADVRDFFLVGCGVLPGALEICTAALARADVGDTLDPRPAFSGLRCPVELIHGMDDDVIPYVQAHKLAEAINPHAPARVHITGLYEHTAKSDGEGKRSLRDRLALGGELVTMARILSILASPGPARVT